MLPQLLQTFLSTFPVTTTPTCAAVERVVRDSPANYHIYMYYKRKGLQLPCEVMAGLISDSALVLQSLGLCVKEDAARENVD